MAENQNINYPQCIKELLSLRDSFDTLSGKWKLPIMQYLFNRKDEFNHFRKIADGIPGISDKMLAKELTDLVHNHLICKIPSPDYPLKKGYSISQHGESTIPVIKTLVNWGKTHREVIKTLA
ncbi:helix-turn-helix domain-containing protein [Pedobacter aquatilis]|uniref:winged helix-turn-helix transcriptional regulator n=1 Tax=Pedobacter aquatilis TaxID=351343 RepID=UPI00292F6CE6|nr:helix-turn-helix domain-containing protein [Pedobacter aquatilis]